MDTRKIKVWAKINGHFWVIRQRKDGTFLSEHKSVGVFFPDQVTIGTTFVPSIHDATRYKTRHQARHFAKLYGDGIDVVKMHIVE